MFKKNKILAVITARANSKGIKNKNLKKIGKLCLVEHSIKHAKNSKYLDCISVSTDSKKIQKIALENNIWCNVLRPKNISGDRSLTSKAILHVLKNINEEFDYVVELHPTHIFRAKNLIDYALTKLISNKKFDSLISIVKIVSTSHPDFVIKKKLSNKIFFKKSPSVFNRHYLSNYYKSSGVIIVSKVKRFLIEKKMCNGNCYGLVINDFFTQSNIDNPYDYELAKVMWKKKYGI